MNPTQVTDPEGAIRVELFVRSELPAPAEERVSALEGRLAALESAGAVDAVDRTRWAKRVPVAECGTDLRDTYLRFRAWARGAGCSLQPFFGTRECYTPGESGTDDWLVLPAACLAVSVEGELRAVYPHRADGVTRDVEDGLAALADGADEESRRRTLAAD